jgi:hypothetical protein
MQAGAASGLEWRREGLTQRTKIEIIQAGRATSLRRILVFVVSCSLKLIVSEEICGRFDSFDGSASSYRITRILVRLCSEQLHCLDGF